MPEELDLSTLKPAQKRRARKRVGRGMGSGKGRYSGRGLKGQKARSGSHSMRPGFEGGQMPIYMRLGKQRGPTSKDAMPIGPHRTFTQSVNVRDLERVFEAGADVTPEALKAKRLIRTTRLDVKILGEGGLTKALTVSAHRFSRTAAVKIEKVGGSVVWLRGEPAAEPEAKPHVRSKPEPAEAAVEPEASAENAEELTAREAGES